MNITYVYFEKNAFFPLWEPGSILPFMFVACEQS